MRNSEKNANRQLAGSAQKIPGNMTFARVRGLLNAYTLARVVGVNPYNDVRGMEVRS